MYCSVCLFPLHVASELIFWPSEEVMRLVLDSHAVPLPLDCLGKEVLSTAKDSMATVPPPTRREMTPCSSQVRPISSVFPTPGLCAESGIPGHGEGRALL